MSDDNEINRMREILKEHEEICSKQALSIFDLDAEIRTLKLRVYELLEENTALKNKLEYYKNSVMQFRVPFESVTWLSEEIINPSGEQK